MVASALAARDLVGGADEELADAPGDRGGDDVLHLHRLERDDRIAGRDRRADGDVDGQDGARHRGEDVGRTGGAGRPWPTAARAAASTSGGGARRNATLRPARSRWTVSPTWTAPKEAGHGVAAGVAPPTSTRRATPSASRRTDRGGVEPPAAGPRIGPRRGAQEGRGRLAQASSGIAVSVAQSSGGQIRSGRRSGPRPRGRPAGGPASAGTAGS